jgi:hypothetical protein
VVEVRWALFMTISCCDECGADGGVSLKVCKSCTVARYCDADCQRNHWTKHKTECQQRAADEALFKDPPAKEDCPYKLIACSLYDASTRDYSVRTNL